MGLEGQEAVREHDQRHDHNEALREKAMTYGTVLSDASEEASSHWSTGQVVGIGAGLVPVAGLIWWKLTR